MQAKLMRQMTVIGIALAGAALAACAPVVVVPAESPTLEEATLRAADPKAPTGALIFKKPDVVPPTSAPKQ